MLTITINNTSNFTQFNTILQNLKGISNSLLLNCDEKGIYAQGMDGSHVCLFELKIGEDWFDEYKCDEACSMGINCEMLYKILSCLKEGQHISMRHDNTTSKLTIDLLGNSYDKSFELTLIEIDSDMVELPSRESTADIKFVSKDFAELINQLSIFGEKLKFTCNDDIILNSANEFGKVDITVKEEDIVEYMMEDGAEVESYFGIKFIHMITKFANVNKEVGIHISNDYPIKMVYALDDWKQQQEDEDEAQINHYIAFYLAPMEED